MSSLPRRLARNLRDRLATPLTGRLDGLEKSLAEIGRDVERIGEDLGRVTEMLRFVTYEGPANRRRLQALRDSPEYELAFTEPEPLVSFVIPTYRRFEKLRDVSLPSILAQSYSNIEVIVAGDASPPETEQVVAEVGDPRVRFHNRTVRGPYPEDETLRWYTIGTPPYNDGVAMARGSWIASLGDDDALRPDHTEILLEAARANRWEHCYGRHLVHYPSGETLEVGVFPPVKGEYVLQASIYHSGLRFFGLEMVDHLFHEPNDWSLCRRMLESGVRFGMVPDIVADKYESRYHSHEEWGVQGIPRVE
jgi:Glycosyl transferase family 2